MGLPINNLHQCIIHYFPVERMSPNDNQYEMKISGKKSGKQFQQGLPACRRFPMCPSAKRPLISCPCVLHEPWNRSTTSNTVHAMHHHDSLNYLMVVLSTTPCLVSRNQCSFRPSCAYKHFRAFLIAKPRFSGPMFQNFRPCLGSLSVTLLRHTSSRGPNNAISQCCRFLLFHL